MKKSSYPKYRSPEPVAITKRTWPDKTIEKAPIWVSVDLRDGNQALPVPMSPAHKLEYFQMLVKIGFKEIEVSFPSASQDDFDFVRELIEKNLIPDDVRISVLTQARKHLIERTVESLRGVKQAVVHCYVPSSDLHGEFVFGNDRAKVLELAVAGTQMVKDAIAANGMGDEIGYEFSPEEFTDTDLDFCIDLCNKVKKCWGPSKAENFILNLPATVERRPPNQYADMIEKFCNEYKYMDETLVSIHAHNDQGCAVAASELALLAGATRAEGTIFGHGERTGNLDIMILALNLQSRGIESGLDFSNMPEVVRIVEKNTGIDVHPRHPYAGQLAFSAFSGSHQDAIRKGMERRAEISEFFQQGWKMPYLHLDPADLGRQYEKLIRINSQSGKGGIVFVLEKEFGIYPPKAMHPTIGQKVQEYMDAHGGEIDSAKLAEIFHNEFVNIVGPYAMENFARVTTAIGDNIGVSFQWSTPEQPEGVELFGQGNGPLSAVVNALNESHMLPKFKLVEFTERALGETAHATAMAFIGLLHIESNKVIFGAGEHSNIDRAAIAALISALNRMAKQVG